VLRHRSGEIVQRPYLQSAECQEKVWRVLRGWIGRDPQSAEHGYKEISSLIASLHFG